MDHGGGGGGGGDDDDDNYLTLGPNYMLGSVLMALHAILFPEISDSVVLISDIWHRWEFSVPILHRTCSATKYTLSSHNTGELEYWNVRSKLGLEVIYSDDFQMFLAITYSKKYILEQKCHGTILTFNCV